MIKKINKLESMIYDAIEDAIWNYEFEEKEKVDNIEIDINGRIEDGDMSLFVNVDEYEDED